MQNKIKVHALGAALGATLVGVGAALGIWTTSPAALAAGAAIGVVGVNLPRIVDAIFPPEDPPGPPSFGV